MTTTAEGTWYSARDLPGWLGCHHRTALDARAAIAPDLRAYLGDRRSTAVQLQPDAIDVESLAIVIRRQDAVFPPVDMPEHRLLASRFIRTVRRHS